MLRTHRQAPGLKAQWREMKEKTGPTMAASARLSHPFCKGFEKFLDYREGWVIVADT